MSAEIHKSLVQRFFAEVFNQQRHDTAAEILAANFVAHHPAFPDGIRGPEGIMQMVAMFRAGFPHLHYTPEDLIAEHDKVAARWRASGTHQGMFLHIAPTGNRMSITGIDIFRIADGQIVEAWVNSDFLSLMQQIGAIPAPKQVGA
jgi:steroid delta-isomerase-like uncharacterized protein